jgi:glutamine synthetase
MATSETSISRSEIVNNYTNLDQKGIVIAEYVWIDAEGNNRSKTRVRAPQLRLDPEVYHPGS